MSPLTNADGGACPAWTPRRDDAYPGQCEWPENERADVGDTGPATVADLAAVDTVRGINQVIAQLRNLGQSVAYIDAPCFLTTGKAAEIKAAIDAARADCGREPYAFTAAPWGRAPLTYRDVFEMRAALNFDRSRGVYVHVSWCGYSMVWDLDAGEVVEFTGGRVRPTSTISAWLSMMGVVEADAPFTATTYENIQPYRDYMIPWGETGEYYEETFWDSQVPGLYGQAWWMIQHLPRTSEMNVIERYQPVVVALVSTLASATRWNFCEVGRMRNMADAAPHEISKYWLSGIYSSCHAYTDAGEANNAHNIDERTSSTFTDPQYVSPFKHYGNCAVTASGAVYGGHVVWIVFHRATVYDVDAESEITGACGASTAVMTGCGHFSDPSVVNPFAMAANVPFEAAVLELIEAVKTNVNFTVYRLESMALEIRE